MLVVVYMALNLISLEENITNMELRVVEIAHLKGMTMTDIAKQLGISRVNLSNSLNGNPTLSHLDEVARILGVEVPELFTLTSKAKSVNGYLEYNGRIMKVESIDDVRRFIADVEA